jgi:tetratricopeptide (TPR) repeat protein
MVISRSSAFSFKGQNADIPTIAAKLNVAHVLEGSVRKSGDQLRLTAQLIEVKTDRHLWSKTFDREMKNIFAIQDEIAAAVVHALRITLLGVKPNVAETTPEAYSLYLQARHLISQRTQNSFVHAETLLTKALAMDSGFAPAWTERAVLYESLIGHEALSFEEGYELARRAVQRALKIDPNYGPAYGILARIEMNYDWNFTIALGHLQQALELNPGDAEILRNAARLHRIFGRVDEAIGKSRQALALDPVLAAGFYGLGIELYYAHRPEDAVVHIRAALSLNPVMVGAQFDLGMALLAQGDVPAALAAIEQETDNGFRLTGTAIVHHEQGDAAGSDTALEELIDKWTSLYAYQIASVYAFRSEIDDAFGWLEQAYIIRDSGLPEMLTDPLLTNLHDDPRWDAFLDKMGLPH